MDTRCSSCGKILQGGDVVERGGHAFCDPVCRYRFERGAQVARPGTTQEATGATPAATMPAGSEQERLARQLHTLGRVGWITAALNVAGALLAFVLIWSKAPGNPGSEDAAALVGLYAVSLLLSCFIGVGMWQMSQRQSYGLALSAAAAGLMLYSGCCVAVMLPVAVASLVLLVKPQTAALFGACDTGPVPAHWPLTALLLALLGVVLFPAALVGAGLGVWVLAKADASLPAQQRRLAVAAVGAGVPVFTFSALATPFVLHALGWLPR